MRWIGILIWLTWLFPVIAQDFSGVWQGVLVQRGTPMDQANVIYLNLVVENGQVSGKSRVELLDQTNFSIKMFTGSLVDNTLKLIEKNITSSSNTRIDPKCKLDFVLKYNSEQAYLEGDFVSSDCRGVSGKVMLYRSKMRFNEEKQPSATHLWKKQFVKNYEKGYPAPELLELERKNFVFQPIYFDHDRSEIRPEFFDYLNKIARVMDSHSDLRVRVIGHTDAVGTDAYNIGLSERRARAIKAYFLTRGIPADRLEIDFKGKRQPADTNETPEGKQRNRRVDFEFI
jgi:outer membrane protein OmpA-like peptidoglycan-associated protein